MSTLDNHAARGERRASRRTRVTRQYAIVEAPSVLGLRPTGVETLPDALIGAGLDAQLGARRAGRVKPPPYDDRRDPETLMLNPQGIADYTPKLADAIADVLETGDFPIVLGGDCSIVLGSLLALRRRGRYGLLYVDGHTDFYQPAANINGEAASSDLALATGRGPRIMTTFDGYRPLVRDGDVVLLGFRDAEEAATYGSQLPPPDLRAIDLAEVRRSGIDAAAREAVDRLSRPWLNGFWIHLDADALDDSIMPAVDYRLPDGLSWGAAQSPGRRTRGDDLQPCSRPRRHHRRRIGRGSREIDHPLNGAPRLGRRTTLTFPLRLPLQRISRRHRTRAPTRPRLWASQANLIAFLLVDIPSSVAKETHHDATVH
jgi:arginase